MRTSINLMTDDDRRQQVVDDARRLWLRVLLISTVLLAVLGTSQWWQGRAVGRQLHVLEEQYAPVEVLKDECIRMRSDINQLQEAQQLTLRLVDTRPTVTLLGAVSTAASKAAGDVFVRELTVQHHENATDAQVALLRGYGRDNAAIARFTTALRESQLFADVTLSCSDTSSFNDERVRSFEIVCQL